jgi:zinc/manganese transport system ATP-binding protein
VTVLSVQGISVRLGGRDVLSDVSCAIDPGEFGLIGSNGAGKTTLLRVVLGLQRADGGRVLIAGEPRSRRNPLVGYVPQKFQFDPDVPLRARDLVDLGIDAHKLGFPRPSRARSARVHSALEAVGAAHLADARIGTLSGGEQQRVLIAHALISRPRLLLLDEPLANLDLPSGQGIVQLLSGIAREQGIAVLISAHEMNPLLPVLDRIIYMAGGRAVSGTIEEVVTTETLSKLYGRPVEVLNVHGRVIVVAGGAADDGSGVREAVEIVT